MPWMLASAGSFEPIFVLLGLVLVAAVLVSLVFARFRQSLILGYFICGIALGNSRLIEMLPLGETQSLIAALADAGVILLMFTLGIEFSLTELKKLKRLAVVGGGVQMAATFAAACLVFVLWGGESWRVAALLGFMVALSSTALALKLFQDTGQATGPGARLALGIALFQDIAVIGFMLLMPALYGREEAGLAWPLAGALGRGVLFCAFAWVATRHVVPRLLGLVTATRSRELFTLTVIALCTGIASVGWGMGLSLALGAFVAGLVVSESVYSHRILADVLPFKDLFLALFFISVGLMIDLGVFAERWWFFLLVSAGLFAGKVALGFFAGRVLGYPVRACVQAAIALGSIGEFALVLVGKAMALGVFDTGRQQFFLIVTAISMAMAPLAMRFCGPLSRRLETLRFFKQHVRVEKGSAHSIIPTLHGHAIICGYGPVGRRMDEALRRAGVQTVVVELNVDTVKELKAAGRPVLVRRRRAIGDTAAGGHRAGVIAGDYLSQLRGGPLHHRACQDVESGNPIFCRVKFDKEVEGLRRPASSVSCRMNSRAPSAWSTRRSGISTSRRK